VVTAEAFDVVNVYPNRAQVSGEPVFNPLATWVNSAEDTENPDSKFYSLTMQRDVGAYLFEVGYSGSRTGKGINQIEMNPAILTPAQAALIRSGGTIPGIQARRLFPQFGSRVMIPATLGPGDNDVEARSTDDALEYGHQPDEAVFARRHAPPDVPRRCVQRVRAGKLRRRPGHDHPDDVQQHEQPVVRTEHQQLGPPIAPDEPEGGLVNDPDYFNASMSALRRGLTRKPARSAAATDCRASSFRSVIA
jgi:hypothetical protein